MTNQQLTSKSGTRRGCLLLSFLFNRVLEVLATEMRQEKNKIHPNWKGKLKVLSFAEDMILHVENPKVSTKNSWN